MIAVIVGCPPKVPLAPDAGAVKVIGTPPTGLPAASKLRSLAVVMGRRSEREGALRRSATGRNRRWRSGGDMEDTAGGRSCSCSASLQLILMRLPGRCSDWRTSPNRWNPYFEWCIAREQVLYLPVETQCWTVRQ